MVNSGGGWKGACRLEGFAKKLAISEVRCDFRPYGFVSYVTYRGLQHGQQHTCLVLMHQSAPMSR